MHNACALQVHEKDLAGEKNPQANPMCLAGMEMQQKKQRMNGEINETGFTTHRLPKLSHDSSRSTQGPDDTGGLEHERRVLAWRRGTVDCGTGISSFALHCV